MLRLKKYINNKYKVASLLFIVHFIFLDDVTIFDVFAQNQKLSKLKTDEVLMSQKLEETRGIYQNLKTPSGIERYAREKKLFKKDDEDIFVISYE
jgi:cell division protein DivIC